MSEDYLLGHHATEWARLDAQHLLWREALLGDVLAAGLSEGMRVLDMGCGVGSFLADLAEVVGASGQAVGVERDPSALAEARRRFEGVEHVAVVGGDLTAGPLPDGFDLVVCRWVLSFVSDVDAALARLADCLVPGGVLVVQDYDHDGVNLFPAIEGFSEVIEAFRAAYRDSGGDLYVATRLPGAYRACGLVETRVMPHAMASGPGGAAWTWVARFLREHVGDLAASGHLDDALVAAFRVALDRAEADPDALMVTPLVMTVTGRRGGGSSRGQE